MYTCWWNNCRRFAKVLAMPLWGIRSPSQSHALELGGCLLPRTNRATFTIESNLGPLGHRATTADIYIYNGGLQSQNHVKTKGILYNIYIQWESNVIKLQPFPWDINGVLSWNNPPPKLTSPIVVGVLWLLLAIWGNHGLVAHIHFDKWSGCQLKMLIFIGKPMVSSSGFGIPGDTWLRDVGLSRHRYAMGFRINPRKTMVKTFKIEGNLGYWGLHW